jgi:hypothetical protein
MKTSAPVLEIPSPDEFKKELTEWVSGLSLMKEPGNMNSYEWIETLRVLNCLEKHDFNECFGKDGSYLWNKFVNEKNADVFEFLCYLDLQNGKTLFDYCLNRLRSKSHAGAKA